MNAIKNIDKKARDFLEETGVNVAYMAFASKFFWSSLSDFTVRKVTVRPYNRG
ncbi:MAG: DUF4011 domain-containing protein [Treponema sp.]|nr:DUF4011 domain-containing protein [Treponema sp.]